MINANDLNMKKKMILFLDGFLLPKFFFKVFTRCKVVERLCTKANENLYHMFGEIF